MSGLVPNSYKATKLPDAIYVWLVPSEAVQEQPGSWRIRKWDTEPFPEANFTLQAPETGNTPTERKPSAEASGKPGTEARQESPLLEELDAITEGKSKLDLAEEIWKLRKQVEDARLSAALHENAAEQLAQMAVDSVSPGPSHQEWCRDMSCAPKDRLLLATVDGKVRFIAWGKTSHVPMYGWCLADQGIEDYDLCKPQAWMYAPAACAATKEA